MKKDSFLKAFGYISVIIFVFAVLACIVAAAGATVNIYSRAGEDYTRSTACAYLSQKLHRCGGNECVSVIKGEISDIIVIDNGDETNTHLFCADGKLKEAQAYKNIETDENSGQTVVEAKSLRADIKNGLIEVSVYFENGQIKTVRVYLYGQSETER